MDDAGSSGSPFGWSAIDAARHDHGRPHGQGWAKGAVSRVERSVVFARCASATFALLMATSQVEANMIDRKVAAVRRKVGEASAMGSSSTLASSPLWHEVQVLWEGASESTPHGGCMPLTTLSRSMYFALVCRALAGSNVTTITFTFEVEGVGAARYAAICTDDSVLFSCCRPLLVDWMWSSRPILRRIMAAA